MLVLMCQAGGQRYALDPCAVTQVVPRVQLHTLAGSPEWLAGLCVYRGEVLPVVDLCCLTTAGRCPPRLCNRILLVPVVVRQTTRLCGLLMESVTTAQLATTGVADDDRSNARLSSWGSVLLDSQGVFQMLDLRQLFAERLDRLFPSTAGQD